MTVCQYVSMSICQNVNISECKFSAQVSKEKLFRMSKRCQKTLCWYVNMSICQFVSMSVCQYGRMQLLSLGIKRKVGQNVNRMSEKERSLSRDKTRNGSTISETCSSPDHTVCVFNSSSVVLLSCHWSPCNICGLPRPSTTSH